MPEHCELVEDAPMLDDPVVGGSKDSDRRHHKLPASRRPAHELPVVGATDGQPHGHPIAGAEQVLDREAEVGESGPEQPILLLQPITGRWNATQLLMVHEIDGEQLVQQFKSAGIERLVVVPTHQILVAIRHLSSSIASCSWSRNPADVLLGRSRGNAIVSPPRCWCWSAS